MKSETVDELQTYFKKNITEFNASGGGYSVLRMLLNGNAIGEITPSYWDHNNEITELGLCRSFRLSAARLCIRSDVYGA